MNLNESAQVEQNSVKLSTTAQLLSESTKMKLETLTKKSNINKTSQDVILSSETRNDYPVWENQVIKRIDAICPDISNFGSVFFGKLHLLDAKVKGIDEDVDDLLFGADERFKSLNLTNSSSKKKKDSEEDIATKKVEKIRILITSDVLQKVYKTIADHLSTHLEQNFGMIVKGKDGTNPIKIASIIEGTAHVQHSCGYTAAQLYNTVDTKLQNMSQGRNQSIQDYVMTCRALWQDMKIAEHEMKESNFVRKLVNGLNDGIKIKQNLVVETLDITTCPSLDTVLTKLENYHHSVYGASTSKEISLAARNIQGPKLKCETCGFYRPQEHRCVQCSKCKYWGHIQKYCDPKIQQLAKERQGGSPLSWGERPNRKSGGDHKSTESSGAQDKPHKMLMAKALEALANVVETNDANTLNMNLYPRVHTSLLSTNSSSDSLSKATIDDDNVWIIDSGCTKSVSKTPLTFPESQQRVEYYRNADGSMMEATGVTGQTIIQVTFARTTANLTLSNTAYAPKSAYNLLSIPHICSRGCKVLFDGDECYIYSKDFTLIAIAKRIDDLYCLVDESRPAKAPKILLTKGSPHVNLKLLHERFGHIGIDSIKRLLENDAAHGLPSLDPKEDVPDIFCDACLKGKAHAQPFHSSQTTYKPLENIGADITFPGVESLDGHYCSVTLVDRSTSYACCIPIKRKSDLRTILMDWAQWAERQVNQSQPEANYKIKIITLDGAKEGLANVFKEFCIDRGIELRITLPYTSEQNGSPERKHYTTMNLTRTMILRAKAPENLWHEALPTAAYATNLIVRKGQTKTPYEMFFGRKPNILPLRVWGCRAYVMINPKDRDCKVSPRAEVGRFVGYSKDHKGYRVLLDDEDPDSIVESRNVVMFERVFCIDEDYDNDVQPTTSGEAVWSNPDIPLVYLSPLNDSRGGDDSDDEYIPDDEDAPRHSAPVTANDSDGSTDDSSEMSSEQLTTSIDLDNTSVDSDSLSEFSDSELSDGGDVARQLRDRPPTPFAVDSEVSSEGESSDSSVDPITDVFTTMNAHPEHNHPSDDESEVGTSNVDEPVGLNLQNGQPLSPTSDDSFMAFVSQHLDDTVNPKELRGSERYIHDPSLAIFVVDEPTVQKAFSAVQIPRNVKEALAGADKDLWKEALQKELDSLDANMTWILTPLPPDRKAIPSRWVLTIKYNDKGEIDRYKARLVLQGFRQIYGLDYNETFAPTGKHTTLRLALALAAENGWHDESYDVETAFLNSLLKEEIYMKQPPGFESTDPILKNYVCKLLKSLYGLKQAPREWYQTVLKTLTENGYQVSKHDPCLFTKTDKNGTIVLTVTVDDFKAFSNSQILLDEFEAILKRHFKVKKTSKDFHLGIHIHREGMNKIHINQARYIQDILHQYGMADCRTVATPMDAGLELSHHDCPNTEEERLKMKDKNYRSIIGSLQYLSVATRPDITQAVSKLSRYLQNPGIKMWKAALRVLQYLKGTIHYGITYTKQGKQSIVPYVDNGMKPMCDADLAGDIDTRRSTTGYVVLMSGGAISWGSKLQTVVAHSTTEAEYLAVDYLVREVIWLKRLLGELNYNVGCPTLLSDNNGCIAISKNPAHHSRTKHIDIRYHYIRDQILLQEVNLKYLSTDEMAADMFTKPLTQVKFEKHREKIGISQWVST